MRKGFVIEFSAVTWFSDDGDEHNTVHRFRVLVAGEAVSAYVAHPGPFADGWARVIGEMANAARADLRSCSWPAPFNENRIIALAFDGYVRAPGPGLASGGLTPYTELPNGLTLIDLGSIDREE